MKEKMWFSNSYAAFHVHQVNSIFLNVVFITSELKSAVPVSSQCYLWTQARFIRIRIITAFVRRWSEWETACWVMSVIYLLRCVIMRLSHSACFYYLSDSTFFHCAWATEMNIVSWSWPGSDTGIAITRGLHAAQRWIRWTTGIISLAPLIRQ